MQKTEDILAFKEEISKLKMENYTKINILVKVHMRELTDLQKVKWILFKDIQSIKESFNVKLETKEEDLTPARQTLT